MLRAGIKRTARVVAAVGAIAFAYSLVSTQAYEDEMRLAQTARTKVLRLLCRDIDDIAPGLRRHPSGADAQARLAALAPPLLVESNAPPLRLHCVALTD